MDIKIEFLDKSKNKSFSFLEKIVLVEDKKIKEELLPKFSGLCESELAISNCEKPISELIQIKISLEAVGAFYAFFNPDSFVEDIRKKMIEEISVLKTEETTQKIQTNKIQKLFEILNRNHPLFVTYIAKGKLSYSKSELDIVLKDLETLFPLLILKQKEVREVEVKQPKEKTNIKEQIKETKDTLAFIALFSLCSILFLAIAVSFLLANKGIGYVVIVSSAILLVMQFYASYDARKEINDFRIKSPYSLIHLATVIIGSGAGIGIAFVFLIYIVNKNNDISNNTCVLYASLIAGSLSLISTFTHTLINKIIIKIKKVKK